MTQARSRSPGPPGSDAGTRTPELVQVTAALIGQAGRVLVCQRRPDRAHAGKWEFPGGKQEPGESLADCMRRELREELGIDAQVGEPVWQTCHRYAGRPAVQLTFFRIPGFAGGVANLDFADVRWVSLTELAELDFLDGDREVVLALASGRIEL